jgi:hypothetical protein
MLSCGLSILRDVIWPILRDKIGVLVIDRCHDLSKVWYGAKGCDLHGLWLVFLESAKDLFLGVDTPQDNMRHHVSSIEWLTY